MRTTLLVASMCLWCAGTARAQDVLDELAPAESVESPASEPAPKPVPAGAAEAEDLDRRLEERLRNIFGQVDELEGVRVEVLDGVVHLDGQAIERKSAEKAVSLARGMEGVVYVDDDITQPSEVRARAAPMLERIDDKLRSLVAKLPVFALAIVLMLPFWLVAALVRRWDAPFHWMSSSPLLRDIIRRIAATLVIALGVIAALELMEATAVVGAVLGTAGLLGVAVGFAFRDLIENYLASIMLGVRRPFSARDHVVIDGHEGLVIRLTTRETILMTLDGNHLRLPNAVVFKAVILNFTRNPRRRFDFVVGTGVDEDLGAAQRLGVRALSGTPGVLKDPPPLALIEALGDSNVALRFSAWVDQAQVDYLRTRSEAIRRVKTMLDDAGVDMPVPTYRVALQRRPSTAEPHAAARSLASSTKEEEEEDSEAALAPVDHIEAQILEEESLSDEENLL